MKTLRERNKLHWFTITGMLIIGFSGLFFCNLIEKISGVKASDDKSSLFFIIEIFFLVIWILGLAVFTPIQILYFERNERKNKPLEKVTLGDVAGLPFGAFKPNAQLPKWISVPVKFLFWAIVSFFILFIILILIGIIGTSRT